MDNFHFNASLDMETWIWPSEFSSYRVYKLYYIFGSRATILNLSLPASPDGFINNGSAFSMASHPKSMKLCIACKK